jgi:hypothetical protein
VLLADADKQEPARRRKGQAVHKADLRPPRDAQW